MTLKVTLNKISVGERNNLFNVIVLYVFVRQFNTKYCSQRPAAVVCLQTVRRKKIQVIVSVVALKPFVTGSISVNKIMLYEILDDTFKFRYG